MTTFNLKKTKKTLDNMIKQAMGADAFRYRSQITNWCTLEDAVRGTERVMNSVKDPETGEQKEIETTWAELVKDVPGLKGIIYELLRFKDEKEIFFMRRYGVSKDEVRNFFRVIVGYHPFYGCYACSVGPYYATKSSKDAIKKFAKEINGSTKITPEIIQQALALPDVLKISKKTGKQKMVPDPRAVAAKCLLADKANTFATFKRKYPKATEEGYKKAAQKYIFELMEKFQKFTDLSVNELNVFPVEEKEVVDPNKPKGKRGRKPKPKDEHGKVIPAPMVQEMANMPDVETEAEAEENPELLNWKDLMLTVKEATGQVKSGEEKKTDFGSQTYSLDPNTPSGQKLTQLAPIAGTASSFSVGARGLVKIMNAVMSKNEGWKDIWQKAIAEASKTSNIDPQNMSVMMATDENVMENVLATAKSIRQKLIDSGSQIAIAMPPIPDFKNAKLTGDFGTQNWGALQIGPDIVHAQELKLDVLKAYRKLKDRRKNASPEAVAAELALARKSSVYNALRAKGKIDPESIRIFIDTIKQESQVVVKNGRIKTRPIAELVSEYEAELIRMRAARGSKIGEGTKDFITAMRWATISYALHSGEEPIDKITKGNINVLRPFTLIVPVEGENCTTEKLDGLRTQARITTPDPQIENMKKYSPGPDQLMREILGQPEEEKIKAIDPEKIELEEGAQELGDPDEDIRRVEEEAAAAEAAAKAPADAKQGELPFNVDEVAPETPETPDDFDIIEVPEKPMERQQEVAINPQPVPANAPAPAPAQVEALVPEAPVQNAPQEKRRKKAKPQVNNVMGNTLLSLIKIAKELDDNGKYDAAEKVHAVIRKYRKDI